MYVCMYRIYVCRSSPPSQTKSALFALFPIRSDHMRSLLTETHLFSHPCLRDQNAVVLIQSKI